MANTRFSKVRVHTGDIDDEMFFFLKKLTQHDKLTVSSLEYEINNVLLSINKLYRLLAEVVWCCKQLID